MGFEESLPDDVRRLLENESPAVMARELLRVRALADAHVDALDALRKDLAETRKDREEARAGAKGVWEDLAKARVEVIRLRAEIERLRGDDSRTWLVVELAQTAGVKVTIDEVSSGARTLASVYDAAVAGILETRRLAERYLARKDEDLISARAERADAERMADTLQTTIDETHSVLDEAGVDREDDEGHTMPLWDRVADLVRECDALRTQVDRVRGERDDARAETRALADSAERFVAALTIIAHADGTAPDPANHLADEALKAVRALRKERDEARKDATRADGAADVLRAGLSQLADQALRAEAEVKRLQAADPTTDLYRTAAHETRQILSAALGVHADGVPINELPRQAREVVSQRNTEKSRAYLLGAAVDDANRVLNEAGIAKENDAGQALTLWDRVELLVDERDGARARAAGAKATEPSAPRPMISIPTMCMSKDATERVIVNINADLFCGDGAMDPIAFGVFVREHGFGPYCLVPRSEVWRMDDAKRLLAELERAFASLTKVP